MVARRRQARLPRPAHPLAGVERSSAASKPYLRKHEDDPVFNLTLLQMLRQDFQVTIHGLSGELPSDDHGVDVRGIWERVRARIRTVQGFEVVEEVVLSTFSFAKYLMWKDLSDRTETLKTSPFVRHVIDTPRDAYRSGASFLDPRTLDRAVAPGEIMAPLNADSSQTVAILASGQTGDFVLEGPPGTGKSETIANIIAHNLGLGRRVLFVSEKMAALEVVYRRLHRSGLGDFCLELHSAKANKRAVLDKLGTALGRRSAQSTEEWERKATWLAETREELNGLVEALHKPGPAGLSPREAIGRALRCGDVHRLRLDWARDDGGHGCAPTPEALRHLEDLAKRLGQQFSQLQPEDLEDFKHVAHSAGPLPGSKRSSQRRDGSAPRSRISSGIVGSLPNVSLLTMPATIPRKARRLPRSRRWFLNAQGSTSGSRSGTTGATRSTRWKSCSASSTTTGPQERACRRLIRRNE